MRFFLFTFFSFFTILSGGQENTSKTIESDSLLNQANHKKSRYVIFPGCETAGDKYECYANKLQDFIVNTLEESGKEHLALRAKNDTITLYANIKYDKAGDKILDESRLLSFVKDFDPYLIPVKYALPKVKPALDYRGKPTINSTALTLGFLIDKKTNSIAPLYGYQPQLEPQQLKALEAMEKPPVHPKCNKNTDNDSIIACINNKISLFVSNNFNKKIISSANLSAGNYKILTKFRIDKKGHIIDVDAEGPHKLIEEEAIRVLKLLPKFKPGSLRNKPIIFPYSLPIVFKVE